MDLSATAVGASSRVRCTVTATDGDGGTVSGQGSVTTVNRDPVATAVLSPAPTALRDATLSCTAAATDPDDDAPTLSLAWDVDGTPVSATPTGPTSSSLAGAFSVGQTVSCTATATDGRGGADTDVASTQITNTPPVVGPVDFAEASTRTDDVLTAVANPTDADGDPLTVSYAWTVNGSDVAATGPSLDGAVWFDEGDTVAVTVTADDGVATDVASAPVRTVLNTAPTAPTARIDPELAFGGDTLTCTVDTPSTDADGDPIVYEVTWTVDGVAYEAGGAVDSADTATAGWIGPLTTTWPGDTVDGADVGFGEDWACTLTPFDDDGPGPSATAARSTGLGLYRDYWRQDDDPGVVWVEVDLVAGVPTTVELSTAEAYPGDGEAVFALFDDFDTVDNAKWVRAPGLQASSDGQVLTLGPYTISNTLRHMRHTGQTFGRGHELRVRYQHDRSTAFDAVYIGFGEDQDGRLPSHTEAVYLYSSNDYLGGTVLRTQTASVGALSSSVVQPFSQGTWFESVLVWGAESRLDEGGSTVAQTTGVPDLPLYAGMSTKNSGDQLRMDWVFVRTVDPEAVVTVDCVADVCTVTSDTDLPGHAVRLQTGLPGGDLSAFAY